MSLKLVFVRQSFIDKLYEFTLKNCQHQAKKHIFIFFASFAKRETSWGLQTFYSFDCCVMLWCFSSKRSFFYRFFIQNCPCSDVKEMLPLFTSVLRAQEGSSFCVWFFMSNIILSEAISSSAYWIKFTFIDFDGGNLFLTTLNFIDFQIETKQKAKLKTSKSEHDLNWPFSILRSRFSPTCFFKHNEFIYFLNNELTLRCTSLRRRINIFSCTWLSIMHSIILYYRHHRSWRYVEETRNLGSFQAFDDDFCCEILRKAFLL